MISLRNLAALAVLSFAFAACDSEAASTPSGKWDLDLTETVAALEKTIKEQTAALPEDQRAIAESASKPMLDAMKSAKASMDIKSDGTYTFDGVSPDGKTSKITGKWTLAGDQITMEGSEEGVEGIDKRVGTFNGDTIRFTMDAGPMPMSMVFLRQK